MPFPTGIGLLNATLMKNHNAFAFLLVFSVFIMQGLISSAQSSSVATINSKDDYVHIKASINIVSQKLYHYAQQYPGYTFTPEYSESGKILKVTVAGVSDKETASQISTYLLELEILGEMIRTMNGAHLPAGNESSKKTMLTENEAKQYVPEFGDRTASR
jgi:hypothetical protein